MVKEKRREKMKETNHFYLAKAFDADFFINFLQQFPTERNETTEFELFGQVGVATSYSIASPVHVARCEECA